MIIARALPLLVGCFIFCASMQAQEVHRCATSEAEHKLVEENPELAPLILLAEEDLKRQVAEYMNKQRRSADAQYIIPVVFHILFDFGPEKITDEQVRDAVRILNEDFSAANEDLDEVVASFAGIIGNPDIEFRLARKDPNGNPTNGIVKIQSQETYVGDDGSKLDPWPRDQYLNIWVAREIGVSNAAAYAYLPASADGMPAVDGIICNHEYIGSIGSGSPGSSSRTLTHEVGHFLGLRHPWGPSNDPLLQDNCNEDDGILDTPNTVGSQSCNLNGISCGSLDNVQNFMDYSSCEVMFTEGQVTFMQAVLNASIADREELWQSSNLSATGVVDVQEADFFYDVPVVCMGEDLQLNDRSYYDQSSWNWNFHGGSPGSSNQQHPTVSYFGPGLQRVSLEVSDGSNTAEVSRENAILSVPLIGQHIPTSEDFEDISFPNLSWIDHNQDRDEFFWTTSPGNGYNGGDAMVMQNHGNLAESSDFLYSSTFDLSPLSTVSISFRMSYAQRVDGALERLVVYGSGNCGETWTILLSRFGSVLADGNMLTSSFTPSSNNDWQEITIPNVPVSLRNENFQLRFEFQNDRGNNLYIDDLEITGTYNSVPVLESPANGANFQDANTLLNWKAVQGAEHYEYQLDDQSTLFISPNLVTGIQAYLGIDPKNTDTEFQTSDLEIGKTYYWRVRSRINGVDSDWSTPWSFTVAPNGVGVNELLEQEVDLKVIPNPLGSAGNIQFQLSNPSEVDLRVYDLFGRVVMQVQQGNMPAGTQSIPIEVSGLKAGLYLARLRIGTHEFTEKFQVN